MILFLLATKSGFDQVNVRMIKFQVFGFEFRIHEFVLILGSSWFNYFEPSALHDDAPLFLSRFPLAEKSR
jgi:hypothetical protein